MKVTNRFKVAHFCCGSLLLFLTHAAVDGGFCPAQDRLEALKIFSAPEAHQAAAADHTSFYAIGSTSIARYDRQTGKLIGRSRGNAIHLNSGFLDEGNLFCAHSNYPQRPEQSEIRQLDPSTMRLKTWHSFGDYGGSLTWAVKNKNRWWCLFAHYGSENHHSFLARFDEDWMETGRWTLPESVLNQLGDYSLSGGVWYRNQLAVTGHHDRKLFLLEIPSKGTRLKLMKTLTVPFTGQGIAIDPLTKGLVGINRPKDQVIFTRP